MNNIKAAQAKNHCKERCLERYGVQLSNRMMKKIGQKIESGIANYLRSGSDLGRKVYGVSLNGTRFRVVYDVRDKKLVSFLPNE